MKKNDVVRYKGKYLRILNITDDKVLVIDCVKKYMPYWTDLFNESEVVDISTIYKLNNKPQESIEEISPLRRSEAYKKIKSFFLKNLNHIKREIWNSTLPEYGAYSVIEISNYVAEFIKNNSKVSELYEGSVSDEVYGDIKKKKFDKVLDIIKDCLNENNQTEGNRLISLINDMKNNPSEEKLVLKQVMKM